VEIGRDARARGYVLVPSEGTGSHTSPLHPSGLTLTHEMFSAKVGSGTAVV